ncbi:urease accessory protein UreD [Amycolatopsis sp. NPDC051903]|uniref:urease accessory protein UreD n=1 Tax=Amycolatopsis sp. NPDC051903 TaxID=3363936 RepID=UPI0037931976
MTPRDDRAWCTPTWLPAEALEFGSPVRGGLAVGAPGKVGVLDLELEPRAGRTTVVRQYQRAPLHIYRPIHLDPALPQMAFVYLQQQGDGLVQGDRYRVEVNCAAESAVHLTTQAPTKIFAAIDNYATQLVNLHVGPGAVLEYLPDPVVPFRGSRLFQRTCVTVADDATVILGEVLLPGRVARGETHVYDLFWSELEIRDSAGTVLVADTLRLRPGTLDPRSPGVLGGFDVLASLYVVSRRAKPSDLVDLLRSGLAKAPDVLCGVTELPEGRGASVRILGATSAAVQAAVRHAWERVRLAVLSAPVPDLRKG